MGKAVQKKTVQTDKMVCAYNNLIKVILIEHHVDSMIGPIQVLDLGCGQGQDILKFSRAFRTADIQQYIGVDFAEKAIEEARSRYSSLVHDRKAEKKDEYKAAFFVGDLMSGVTFEKLASAGYKSFNVVSLQFMLHYFAETEFTMRTFFTSIRKFLRPGGRVLGTIPSCEVLAEMCVTSSRGNDLFTVDFEHKTNGSADEVADIFCTKWGIPYKFSFGQAVQEQREFVFPWESFENLMKELGFSIVVDAPFPDLFDGYKATSHYYNEVFLKNSNIGTKLSNQEEELFGLYTCFVLQLDAL